MSLPASVAAGHPATAAAGRDVLAADGSAADAVAAMVLAGCVAETIFSGLGGGGFATVYDAASRQVHCLDFFVAIPGLDGGTPAPGRPIDVAFGGVSVPYEVGGATVGVPGTPLGVAELHTGFGRLPWADVVQPAIDLAAAGVAFPQAHADLLSDIAPAMLLGDGVDTYTDSETGGLLGAGGRLFHPGLAETLGELRDGGWLALRDGDWGSRLVELVRADGGMLSAADMLAYRVRELSATDQPFGSGRVRVRANDLDGVAATFAAVRPREVRAGPLQRARTLIDALRSPARRAETTSVAAVDEQGNACVATHSLGLGSGIWVGGVHANSMLGEGELLRGDLRPGERMGSMMAPLVVTDADDALMMVAGAAGGSRIRPALLQVLTGVLLEGRTLPEAVAAPRLSATADVVHLEPGFDPAVPTGLRAAGDAVVEWEAKKPYFGGVAGVGPGGPAADPRRGGVSHVVPSAEPDANRSR